jgi:hypothetical protein
VPKARHITPGNLRARWLERECLRLKKLGVSYLTIADMITRAAAGERNGVQLPDREDNVLPAGYRVSHVACYKAVKRALYREPNQQANELRRIDVQRINGWLLNMAGRLQAGEPDAIRAALQALKQLADLNGYGTAAPSQTNNLIINQQVNEILQEGDIDRAFEAELSRRLGRPVTIEQAIAALRAVGEGNETIVIVEEGGKNVGQ